jgi:methyl-accepting chemotaxis protein
MTKHTVRRRVIVDGFQRRFVVIQVAWMAAGLLVLAIVLLTPQLSSGRLEADGQSGFLTENLLIRVILWSTFVAISVLLAALFIRMSHRVAGALVRFRHAFRQVADGRLDFQVTTRKGDYLTAERDELNAMIASLRARIRDSQAAIAELDRLLAAVSHRGTLSSADVEQMQGQAASARAGLAQFSVG